MFPISIGVWKSQLRLNIFSVIASANLVFKFESVEESFSGIPV